MVRCGERWGLLNKKLVFIGEYTHVLDEKGRLAIPVKFRKDLTKGAVITKGLDGALFLYSQEQWGQIAHKLSSLPFNQKNTRAFSRFMLSGAMEVKLDKQGRVIVPTYLSKYSKLQQKIIIIGVYDRIEIWDETCWIKYKSKTESKTEDIAEQLTEF